MELLFTILDVFIVFVLVFVAAPVWMYLMTYMAMNGIMSSLENSIVKINKILNQQKQ